MGFFPSRSTVPEDEELALVALSIVPELGSTYIKRLIQSFGSATAVFEADNRELKSVKSIGAKRSGAIKAFKDWEPLRKKIDRLRTEGVSIVGENSPHYPAVLRELPDSPAVLYMRGQYLKDDKYAIAMVGSRMPTGYGKSVAENIAADLGSMGFTIISGLARGIDTHAHTGAVRSGARTIGVMGSGIDVPYPPENRGLMRKISEQGVVLSEFPPGSGPIKENFPRRNRLISGLSLGVIVVEAQRESGSLITARLAHEQGREVFCVPGNISSGSSEGTNELIKNGEAVMLLKVRDVVDELAPILKGFIQSQKKRAVKLTKDEQQVAQAMSPEPRHVDDISSACGLSASKTLALLLALELKGAAGAAEGKTFYLK